MESAFSVVDGRVGYGGKKRAGWRKQNQLQVSAVQTPAGVLFALLISRSTKSPTGTETLPVTGHVPPDPFGIAVQVSAVVVMLPGVPTRSDTVIVCPCWE
jgi:hypothetical protein